MDSTYYQFSIGKTMTLSDIKGDNFSISDRKGANFSVSDRKGANISFPDRKDDDFSISDRKGVRFQSTIDDVLDQRKRKYVLHEPPATGRRWTQQIFLYRQLLIIIIE